MTDATRLESKVIRGLKTSWLEDGTPGNAIVFLLHGFPDTPEIWDFQVEELSRRFHCIRPYNRGTAESEPASDIRRYGADAHALDFLEILREIDPDGERQVSVIGHDLGAVLAWNLASLLGPRLSRLVVFNGLSLPQMWRRFWNPRQQLRSWYIYLMQVPGLAEKAYSKLPKTLSAFTYQTGKLPLTFRPEANEFRDKVGSSFKMYRSFARTQRTKTLPLRCPTLVLWGNADPFLEIPRLEEIEQDCEKVSMRILEGGHWIFREKSQEVNALLDSFLPGESNESARSMGIQNRS